MQIPNHYGLGSFFIGVTLERCTGVMKEFGEPRISASGIYLFVTIYLSIKKPALLPVYIQVTLLIISLNDLIPSTLRVRNPSA